MPEYDEQGFVFGGVNSTDFGLWVSGEGTFTGTKRDTESVKIPGRNGTLLLDNGRYENVTVSYNCYVLTGMYDVFRGLRDALSAEIGYKRLADTFHPDEFRLAQFTGGITPSMGAFQNGGTWTVSFDAKPQRFLTSGDVFLSFTQDGELLNPAKGKALPLIRVYGSGTLGIGEDTITVASNDYPYIDIDCETMEAVYNDINCNGLVTLTGFPVLGEITGVVLDGLTCDIKPRWFRL